MHHAEEHLQVVPRRGQVTDGPAGAGDVGADILPATGEAGDALNLVGGTYFCVLKAISAAV